MANNEGNIFLDALLPFQLLSYTLLFIPGTILEAFTTERNSTSSFHHRWFARFWSWFGPRSQQKFEPIVRPMLYEHASGAVLDIGTGAGHWLHCYDKSKITKIVAVEANREQHPGLLRSARAAGLQDRFEIAAVPVEELQRTGVAKESFDTVLTLNVMCSATDPAILAKGAYELLKPGGKWIVFEHVRAHSKSGFINWWQKVVNNIWPFFMGGCSLLRETHALLKATGPWKKDNVQQLKFDSPYSVIPSVMGVLYK